jgi:hypothetical protein
MARSARGSRQTFTAAQPEHAEGVRIMAFLWIFAGTAVTFGDAFTIVGATIRT